MVAIVFSISLQNCKAVVFQKQDIYSNITSVTWKDFIVHLYQNHVQQKIKHY